jgi:two-component system OmpR family response regulator
MQGKKVLVVDDEPDIRRIATIALERFGGCVVQARASGQEAIAAVSADRPDLILLDVMMPDMDGPAALLAIRRLAGGDMPIVFLTAKVQRHEVDHYRAIGAAGVVAKPFDPLTLADDLAAMLRQPKP